jgi:hypothetical protein
MNCDRTFKFSRGKMNPKHDIGSRGLLLAILATPTRTRARLELARDLLGYGAVSVVNMLDVPTVDTNEISKVGQEAAPWLQSRTKISTALPKASGVILGYGKTEPSGGARQHHRNQVEWLHRELETFVSPIWSVGNEARHPSRWQRFTSMEMPELSFSEALLRSFTNGGTNHQ